MPAAGVSGVVEAVSAEQRCAECGARIPNGARALALHYGPDHRRYYLCRQHFIVSLMGGPLPIRVAQAGWRGARQVHLPDWDTDTLEQAVQAVLPGDVVTFPEGTPMITDANLRRLFRAANRGIDQVPIYHRQPEASREPQQSDPPV